jgi:hypothetical protein
MRKRHAPLPSSRHSRQSVGAGASIEKHLRERPFFGRSPRSPPRATMGFGDFSFTYAARLRRFPKGRIRVAALARVLSGRHSAATQIRDCRKGVARPHGLPAARTHRRDLPGPLVRNYHGAFRRRRMSGTITRHGSRTVIASADHVIVSAHLRLPRFPIHRLTSRDERPGFIAVDR